MPTYHFKFAIADAGDCLVDSGVMIDIIQCTSPWTVTTATTPAGCGVNNGTATATVTGGIGPFSYSWAPSGGTGSTATGLAAGSYTVTVNDGLTCTPAQTYTVTVAGSGGSPVAANSQTICAGATTTLTLRQLQVVEPILGLQVEHNSNHLRLVRLQQQLTPLPTLSEVVTQQIQALLPLIHYQQ
ncbi:MAG: SprB repeat-containing protein [Bacteroidetes bacterium]|nr:SprB repeat-containing protein [Bacteroidota bacterium]